MDKRPADSSARFNECLGNEGRKQRAGTKFIASRGRRETEAGEGGECLAMAKLYQRREACLSSPTDKPDLMALLWAESYTASLS